MLQRWRKSADFADKIFHDEISRSALAASDRAFAHELFYGVLRNRTLLDFCIGQLRATPLDDLARDILRLGFYQILLLQTPPHAAVFETVELARPSLRGLMNALLRRASREKNQLLAAADEEPIAIKFSEPEFLTAKWERQFGFEQTTGLCQWNNQPAVNYARINRLKLSREKFLGKYPAAAPISERSEFVRLNASTDAIENGDCYIQDPSTALACELLAPAPNELALDACAAPGGKSALLAALMQNEGRLVAVDRDDARLERLRENLVRLEVKNASVVRHDWLVGRSFSFPAQSFDKILLDVPCSNTGVMRRRVDVRWRLQPDDFVRMPMQQLAIFQKVAPLLRTGGSLVYSTCSLEPEENEDVVRQFLRENPAFRLTKNVVSLPWREGFDGAFAAHLHRPVAVE